MQDTATTAEKAASKRVGGNLFTHKASGSSFDKINYTVCVKKEFRVHRNSLHPFYSADIATKPIRALLGIAKIRYKIYSDKSNCYVSAIFYYFSSIYISTSIH